MIGKEVEDSSFFSYLDDIIKVVTPIKNKDYFDGKDGYTPVKGIDYSDGINGNDGKDGYTPIKNKDYFDGINGKDGLNGKNGKDGRDGRDGKDGLNGKDGVSFKAISITPRLIRDKLEGLEGDARLDASAIKNIERYASNKVVTATIGGTTLQEPTTWGTITGTLSAQLDLQSVLDGKLSVETDPVFMAWDKDYADLINKPTIPTLTWGAITGTLSTQTDLTDYIDNKILINDTSDNINAIVYAIALG